MNVLLLGNRFDLSHDLPTLYNDFLQTVNFLINCTVVESDNVGKIFSNLKLQTKSEHIEKCYAAHKVSYNQMSLNIKEIDKITKLAQNNIWFTYLLKSVKSDTQWIDVEREIAFVLQMFQEFFCDADADFAIAEVQCSEGCRYVMENFSFFYSQKPHIVSGAENVNHIQEQYYEDYPPNSGNKKVNKDKVIKTLYKELEDFAECLRLYLKCFVDDSLDLIKNEVDFKRMAAICSINQTVTFNYTNTTEKFYSQSQVFHLHGNINDKIILGINPDENDMLETIDTTVLSFKKYYQRVCLGTDNHYIKWLKKINESMEEISLLIMGHSLDVTDKDIIKDLFNCANEIIILYHSEESQQSLVKNLIKIFGFEEFNRIRNNKGLSFMSTSSDFSEFIRMRQDKQYEELAKKMALDEYNSNCKQIYVV